jgi:putative protease
LAPAKNKECGIAAIDHGADAVYIGAQRFGARAAAGNSVDDIAELCRYAHLFGAKVYVTINTIIYDDELDDTTTLMRQLKEVGVDAFLVQDMAPLQLPPARTCSLARARTVGSAPSSSQTSMQASPSWGRLEGALHASTQTDNRTAEKVRWLRSLGFRRVVLARELSVEEIAAIHKAVPDVELEVFVHGALCVSYSGQCYASQYCFGRSANRGECAQFCRLKFDLKDADGNMIAHQRHLLSLKDMCRIDHLEELMEAGAMSFKIEGRLKDVAYVKNVVAAYSKRLDSIIARHPDRYQRASLGRSTYSFEPRLEKTFSRGFTTYFLHGRKNDIASFDTPKAIGEYVGYVKEIRGGSFNVAGTAAFANGDGLCFFNDEQELEGFRVNRAEGNRLFPQRMPHALRPGTRLYRNHDIAFEKVLGGKTAERKIPVSMRYATTDTGFSLTVSIIGTPISADATVDFDHQEAARPQEPNLRTQLSKLGDTPYEAESIEIADHAAAFFIPNSLLTKLRREAVESLQSAQIVLDDPEKLENPESPDNPEVPAFPSAYPYLLNVANARARAFYESQGVKDVQPAFEIAMNSYKEPLLMQCRHCLRYTLGYCVKHGGKKPTWKEPLYLELPDKRRFSLLFDCKQCQMNIKSLPPAPPEGRGGKQLG